MKALFAHAAKDLRLEDAPQTALTAGTVRVAIAQGGICGSDLHYFNHGGFGDVRLREPMILGHEIAGTVVEGDTGSTGLEPGDLVAVNPSHPCGRCGSCRAGLPNHCLDMRFLGSAMRFPHVQGGFRETLDVSAEQCVSARGLSAAQAAMAEPLAVALHAVSRAGSLLGKRVLITGCGPIGLLCLAVARRAGAVEILAADLQEERRARASAVGADKVLAPTPESAIPLAADKGSVDVHIECAGSEAALSWAVPCVRPRGIIVQVGFGDAMKLPMLALTAKEIDLRGSFRFCDEFAKAVRFLQAGLIDVRPLITHTFPLADFAAAFAMANDTRQSLKVHLAFPGA